ncbi:MAG: class I SAM-dependent methyltransferase [Deltaproteobacteria bacterium]|nr:class I SAM-dependent methyltransferase [Deltaproteobacteria bacterium]
MDWSEIVELVRPYHGLQDPDLELPAILGAFGRTKALSFLEIGTYQGGTSTAVALAYPDAEVFTVDLPVPEEAVCNAQSSDLQGIAFKKLCPGWVVQFHMDSADLCDLSNAPPLLTHMFDMVFVDGDHRVEPTLTDLRNAAKLIRDDGVILVHDYTDARGPHPRPHWTVWVHEAVHRFAGESGFTVQRLAGTDLAAAGSWTWLALLSPPDRKGER